jgi:hypothetical protein
LGSEGGKNMYCELELGKMENVNYDEILQQELKYLEASKTVKGLVSAIWFSDKEKGEYGYLAVYETKEDQEAHFESYPDETKAVLAKYFKVEFFPVNFGFSKEWRYPSI